METQAAKRKLKGLAIRGICLLISALTFTGLVAKYVVPYFQN